MNIDEAQGRVSDFVMRCFGEEQSIGIKVRALRLLEEAIEFAQSAGVEPAKAHELIEYVFARPAGGLIQELGGVAITWLAACNALQTRAHDVMRLELERVESKPAAHFSRRNQVKNEAGFGGSTLQETR